MIGVPPCSSMRRLLPSVSAILIALPIAASAFFQKPSDLLLSLKSGEKPINFSYQLQGHAKNLQGSDVNISFFGSITGAAQGSSPADAKANVKLEMTIAGIDGSDSIHSVALMRLTDKKLYVQLADLDGTYKSDALLEVMNAYGKRWYVLPTTELEKQQQNYSSLSPEDAKNLAIQCLDAMFSIDRSQSQGGNLYSITLKPNAADALFALKDELQKQYPSEFSSTSAEQDLSSFAQFKEALSHLNIHVKILTDATDVMRSSKYYLAFSMVKADMGDVGFVVSGEMKVRSAPVSVVTPIGATDLSDLETPAQNPAPSSSPASTCTPSNDPRVLCISKPPRR
jgi:hypothetical protein